MECCGSENRSNNSPCFLWPFRDFFLLTHGHARHFFNTENGRKMLLRWLVPGDVTGAASLLSKPAQYQMGTEVVEDSRFLVWDRITLGRLGEGRRAMGWRLDLWMQATRDRN
jgi:CRP-like cAMP-binding protein